MEQTLLSRQDLAKRWAFTGTKVISNYEADGIIKRVPGLPIPRYALSQIEEIENAGLDLNPLSPVERRRLEKRIEYLEKELDICKEKIEKAKMCLG
ncbi:transcription factor [Clostridium sp.]|uniref:transcription factor n=1 Tax=Clostridium sp. TaxID=1506 RepID=UPI0028483CCC|nr:transcription factor [Clostridium sp.]MDR3596803.1 transcription factor [Clostridium sp.]